MSLLGKIKYFFDGAEEAEESGLILSRRKFFIASAALMVVPKVIDPFFDKLETGRFVGINYSTPDGDEYAVYDVEGYDAAFTDFISPGAIEVQRYQKEIFETVKRKFNFNPLDPRDMKAHPIEGQPARYFEKLAIPTAVFHKFELGETKEPRPRTILPRTKLGYRVR